MSNPTWRNVFGKEIDLDTIDRNYALNILLHRSKMGLIVCSKVEYDALTHKLIERIRDGHKPGLRDWSRRRQYNFRCRRAGLPYRAR
jgi:hypothetical protein